MIDNKIMYYTTKILDINYVDYVTISAVFHTTSRIGASFYIYNS